MAYSTELMALAGPEPALNRVHSFGSTAGGCAPCSGEHHVISRHTLPAHLPLLAHLPAASADEIRQIKVSVNDKQCNPMALTVPAGKTQFIIKNESMRARVEILDESWWWRSGKT